MTVVISAEDLGKRYQLRHRPGLEYPTFRDEVSATLRRTVERLLHPSRHLRQTNQKRESFWALRRVSFSVERGEKVGVIGRNGAGKTTLLKILSRITEPTAGRVTINGRVACLLEVGTGFHPELTGRENVYLNGAILGMERTEIRRAFDEIVAFAEVERFLDTPVKRYSSGMYVRLAFSVAAHLRAEILVVDEVLAVGDLDFQKKCIGKMHEAGREGRTVLFVSHNMQAVSALCERAIVLDKGSVLFDGGVHEGVGLYRSGGPLGLPSIENCAFRDGQGGIRLARLELLDESGTATSRFRPTDCVLIATVFEVDRQYRGTEVEIGVGIDNEKGERLSTAVSTWNDESIRTDGDRLETVCALSGLPFVDGRYLLSISVSHRGVTLDYVKHCGILEIAAGSPGPSRRGPEHGDVEIGSRFSS
jgi:lipopolysaccharide transport system ATP-binding protein